MPRQRRPERDEAFKIYKENKGKISPKDIAERLGVSVQQIRKWKSIDKWDEKRKRRRGAPDGNQNAKGNSGGAPLNNRNAEKFGIYSQPRLESLTPEQREYIGSLELNFIKMVDAQYKELVAKKFSLSNILDKLNGMKESDMLDSKSSIMAMPNGSEMKVNSRITVREFRLKVENEMNKVDGRIDKLIDKIKTHMEHEERMEHDREKLEFNKQKTSGEFRFDENGALDLSAAEDEIEIEIIE